MCNIVSEWEGSGCTTYPPGCRTDGGMFTPESVMTLLAEPNYIHDTWQQAFSHCLILFLPFKLLYTTYAICGGKQQQQQILSQIPQFKFWIKGWMERKTINKKQASILFSKQNVLSLTHDSLCVQASTHTESRRPNLTLKQTWEWLFISFSSHYLTVKREQLVLCEVSPKIVRAHAG